MLPPWGNLEFGGSRLDHLAVRAWSSGMLRVFGFRLVRIGTPVPAATLFVANHVSWVDIVTLHSQRMMGFVAKREIAGWPLRSEEHTSELQSLMRISYAVFCLK